MGGIEIIENGMTYSAELDAWIDGAACEHIKNEFDPESPIYIDVSGPRWDFSVTAMCYIDWTELSLPFEFEQAFQFAVKKKLSTVSETYVSKTRLMLAEFKSALKPGQLRMSDLRMPDVLGIWNDMGQSYRPFFRTLYATLVAHGFDGANPAISKKLKAMKGRSDVQLLKNVLNWHPTKGALTQEEEALLRRRIKAPDPGESIRDFGARLYCWLLLDTLKRGKQITGMTANCLKSINKKGTTEFFVRVKPVKAQTGESLRWWVIPEALYREMVRYSSDASVRKLQKKYNRFLVLDTPSLHEYGTVNAQDARGELLLYQSRTACIVSPRTGEHLHVTANRLRHTGATRLAYCGVARDIIAEILEHDEPGSCQAYIDAVGSELCPSMERADRNMGSLFMHLNHAYFNGAIVDEIEEQPIFIPDFDEADAPLLFVGACGRDTCKEGTCKKHPFVGCYNGCPSFLAWREADHYRALAFADKELERWRKATGNPDKASTILEYEELRINVLAVIDRISQSKGGV